MPMLGVHQALHQSALGGQQEMGSGEQAPRQQDREDGVHGGLPGADDVTERLEYFECSVHSGSGCRGGALPQGGLEHPARSRPPR